MCIRDSWQPVPLPELSPRTIRSLVSTTQYQRRNGLPSNGVARKRLMERGSVQIKLGGKTLWVETPAPVSYTHLDIKSSVSAIIPYFIVC